MKKTVLFGAGQIGTMTANLLGTGYRIVCFADNDPTRQGQYQNGLPILSPEASLMTEPHCFCLGVLDDTRAAQMEQQIRALGFSGEIIRPNALKIFDARTGIMRLLAQQLTAQNISGEIAEVGVYRGDFAVLINDAFPTRKLHLFDTFTGFPAHDIEVEQELTLSHAKAGDFSDTNQNTVYHRMPYPEQIILHKGYFPDTFVGCEHLPFAFVSLDADLYAPTAAALPLFWQRLSVGGVLMIHDYNSTQFNGAKKAVDAFCAQEHIYPVPICDLHGSVLLVKHYSPKTQS